MHDILIYSIFYSISILFDITISTMDLVAKKLQPPYVPKHTQELAYFDKNLTQQAEVTDTILTASQRALINKGQHQQSFDGFGS